MRDPKLQADLDQLRTSERLGLWADMGARVRAWGPIEEDSAEFGQRILRAGLMPVEPSTPQDTVREHIHALHATGRWANFGFNVFDLSLDLAAGFLLTDPLPMEANDELRLPFPCFYIKLPEGIVPMFARGQQFWAEGIWVHRFTSFHNDHGARTAFLRWTVERKSLSVWKDRFPSNLDDPVDQSRYNLIWEGDPPYVPEDQITTDKALRIIKNLVAWLDATGGLTAHPAPEHPYARNPRKASPERQREIATGIWPHVWLFGKGVKLQPELRKVAREFALSQSQEHALPGWKVRVQHVVRGHWKNQAHGEGRSLRKRIWLQPYYRGPEGEAAWAHLYEAGET